MPSPIRTYYFFQQQDSTRQISDTIPSGQKDSTHTIRETQIPVSSGDSLEKMMMAAERRLQKIDSVEKASRKPRVQKVVVPVQKPRLLDSTHIIIRSTRPPVKNLYTRFHQLTAANSCQRPQHKSSGHVFIETGSDTNTTTTVTLNRPFKVLPRETSLLKENWMFPVILFAFVLMTWARIAYGKMFRQTIIALFNRKAAINLSDTRSSLYQRMGLMLFIHFIVTGTLFIYLFTKTTGILPANIPVGTQLFYYSAGLIFYFLYSFVITRLTGIISGTRDFFQAYFQYVMLFLYSAGLYLFPVVAVSPYIFPEAARILIFAGLIILISLYLLRLFWLSYMFVRESFSGFYLFLYLCALEILPLLIFIRLLIG